MASVKWDDSRCIICMRQTKLSLEHIIPQSIGGNLTCKFLCKDCNDIFGHSLDHTLKTSAPIRLAIISLQNKLPDLHMSMESGQPYIAKIGNQVLRSKFRKHGQLSEAKLDDGSLLVPEGNQSGHIKRKLTKSGLSDYEISLALDRLEQAEASELVDLGGGYEARKWIAVEATPDLGAKAFSALAAVKITYEFLALCIGSNIYQPIPPLERCRKILMDLDEAAAQEMVSFRRTMREYDTFHGLFLDGTTDPTSVQIRLFGQIAILVQFPGLSISKKYVFTQDVSTGEVLDARKVK